MYPKDEDAAKPRLAARVERRISKRIDFEIDACLLDATSAVIFELKASWVREDRILSDDPKVFAEHIQELYGTSGTVDSRPKGIAQLARIIGTLARGEWKGDNGEYADIKEIYPVLLVHDERIAAPGSGHFLDQEFMKLVGQVPEGIHVRSLIIMTINDLENLQCSLEGSSLVQFLRDYSVRYPNRMRSLHNFTFELSKLAARSFPPQ